MIGSKSKEKEQLLVLVVSKKMMYMIEVITFLAEKTRMLDKNMKWMTKKRSEYGYK